MDVLGSCTPLLSRKVSAVIVVDGTFTSPLSFCLSGASSSSASSATPPSSVSHNMSNIISNATAMELDQDDACIHLSSDMDRVDSSPLPLGKRKLNGTFFEPASETTAAGCDSAKKIKIDALSYSTSSAMRASLSTIENRPLSFDSSPPSSSATLQSDPNTLPLTATPTSKPMSSKVSRPKNSKMPKVTPSTIASKKLSKASSKTPTKATGAAVSSASPSSAKSSKMKTDSVTSASGLVSIKNSKLIVNQKSLSAATWDGLSSSLRKRLAFTDWAVDLLLSEKGAGVIDTWPKQYWPVVGRLLHESDKEKTSSLVNYVRKQLASYIEGARPRIREEYAEKRSMAASLSPSSSTPAANASTIVDAISVDPLAELVQKLAERKYYGFASQADINAYHASTLDPSDDASTPVSPFLGSSFETFKAGILVCRWELIEQLEDEPLWPGEIHSLLQRRQLERLEFKKDIFEVLMKLNTSHSLPSSMSTGTLNTLASTETTELSVDMTSGSLGEKRNSNAIHTENALIRSPIASGSGSRPGSPDTQVITLASKETKTSSAKKDKMVMEKEEVVLDPIEKQKLEEARAILEEEKARKKAARDQAAALREEKRLRKAQEESDRLAKAEKKKQDLKKSSGFLTGFLIKKSASPVPAPIKFVETDSTADGDPSVVPVIQQWMESEFDKTFKPFYIKSDVTVAPINRCKKAKPGKSAPDVVINCLQNQLTAKEALQAFLVEVPSFRQIPYNPHPNPKISVREVVRAINDSLLTGADATAYYKMLQDRRAIPTKLLKFKEDVRPGYVGTWTKSSKVIGPRTPFAQDVALLRYDYDSEEEWEEDAADADADDVASNANEDEEDVEDSDALSDDWMCDDDEIEYLPGHEDEDETMRYMNGDDELSSMEATTEEARRKVLERERKSKAAREGAKKKKVVGPLLPIVKGPAWEKTFCGNSSLPAFDSMRITFLNDAYVGLNPFRFVSKPFLQSTTKQQVVALKQGELDASKATLPMQVDTTNLGAVEVQKAAASLVDAVSNTVIPESTESSLMAAVPGTTARPNILAAKPSRPAKTLPAELVPSLISLILAHSKMSQPDLIDLVWDTEKFKLARATKGMIGSMLKKVAVKVSAGGVGTRKGGEWRVNLEVLQQHPQLAENPSST